MCMCGCKHVYLCVCVHSLSVEDVRALKQKPSLGFCLAGSVLQLNVHRKGRASLLSFFFCVCVYVCIFKNLLFICIKALHCILISLVVLGFICTYIQATVAFHLPGKNERPPYTPFGSQVCCLYSHSMHFTARFYT